MKITTINICLDKKADCFDIPQLKILEGLWVALDSDHAQNYIYFAAMASLWDAYSVPQVEHLGQLSQKIDKQTEQT